MAFSSSLSSLLHLRTSSQDTPLGLGDVSGANPAGTDMALSLYAGTLLSSTGANLRHQFI